MFTIQSPIMKKFPSIEQFRNVIRDVRTNHDYQGKDESGEPIYRHDSPYPTIRFTGTVKIHGTNAAIVKYADGTYQFQSRERVLSLNDDNAGFMATMQDKVEPLFNNIQFDDYAAIYGEWCGKSIQKGVAVSELPKMFVVFACKVDDEWVDCSGIKDRDNGIFNVNDFKKWEISIDFNHPELSQNTLIDITEAVERECPVGFAFGVIGVGEGVVWTTPDRRYCFKVKGDKHSVTKVKTLANVNVEAIAAVNEFVEYAVTEARLQQGIEKLRERGLSVDQKSTGEFLRWIVGDIVKEEGDTITANGLDAKKVNSAISNKARVWYLNNF